jgi:hypothetical protein
MDDLPAPAETAGDGTGMMVFDDGHGRRVTPANP